MKRICVKLESVFKSSVAFFFWQLLTGQVVQDVLLGLMPCDINSVDFQLEIEIHAMKKMGSHFPKFGSLNKANLFILKVICQVGSLFWRELYQESPTNQPTNHTTALYTSSFFSILSCF
jgi:hypothetical protein